jgi:hypothetical protein
MIHVQYVEVYKFQNIEYHWFSLASQSERIMDYVDIPNETKIMWNVVYVVSVYICFWL